jgi:predicted transcriptional regulator
MKTMKIKILSRKEFDDNLLRVAQNFDKKIYKKSNLKNGIYFESLAAVRKILTDKRLDVWRAIRDKKPESITHLAKILERGLRPVHRDVMLLKDLGLIKLTEGPGKRGNVQKIISLCDELLVAVA